MIITTSLTLQQQIKAFLLKVQLMAVALWGKLKALE